MPEEIRRDEAHFVTEEGRTVLEQRRKEADGHPLEAPCVLGRDAIPELGIAVVQVVDRVEIHVLRVPGERRLPHAEVKVGRVDAVDFDLVMRNGKLKPRT